VLLGAAVFLSVVVDQGAAHGGQGLRARVQDLAAGYSSQPIARRPQRGPFTQVIDTSGRGAESRGVNDRAPRPAQRRSMLWTRTSAERVRR